MNEHEHTLLNQAVTAAAKLTGLDISVEGAPGQDGRRIECVITIRGQGSAVSLSTEIVRNLTKTAIGPVAAKIRNFGGPALLVTPYVNRNMAERLKTLGVPFLDLSGNLFINVPPYFIYVVGQARAEEASVAHGTAFNPMGLQVIFTLLCMPERVSSAYREIAENSGVSLGTVANTLTALERGGYIADIGNRGRALANVEELARRWVMDYAERLRPKLFMGRYSPTEPTWSAPEGTSHFLGGETAGALLTEHLKPALQTFYLKGELKDFAIANRLKKDPQGPVECLKAFWRFDYLWNHGHMAPPLIIYADLVASGDPRNLETAEIIHERFLSPLFARTR